MDTKCSNSYFESVFSEKSEVNSSAEFTLNEYMQGIKRIVKTDAHVRILEKVINDNKVIIGGETIFSVIYACENNGHLKCVTFKEPFDLCFDRLVNADENCENYISVKTTPIIATSRNTGTRLINARGRFNVICEVYSIKSSDICDVDETAKCETESLRKNIVKAQIEIADGIRKDISGEISIDDGAPEVSEIVCYDTGVCIDTTEVSDGIVKIRGKVLVECLYESREDDTTEYVSMEKTVPFEAEADVPCIESGWQVCVNAIVDTSNLTAVSDNYGEQRMLEFSVSLIMKVTAAKNNDCVVITDMYSTNKNLVPYLETKRIYSLIDVFSTETEYKDRVRIDLRGISDIISCKLDMCFGTPDFADGTCYIPAKGTLDVLGAKENGEIDSQSAVLNLRIPMKNIPAELLANRIKWIGETYLCDSECMISGGELEMFIRTDGKVLAFLEDSVDIITGYELTDLDCESSLKSGFSLYYPVKGENVWNVAKAHGVSYDRVKKDNSIANAVFDSETPVILR